MRLFSILIFLSVFLDATTLKELINNTLNNNQNLKSLKIQTKAKHKDFQSTNNTYNPVFNLGANLTRLDGDMRSVQVGTTAVGFASVSVDLYNGGRNTSMKKQKKYEYESSLFDTTNSEKETILQVVTLFFQAKTIQENIYVFEEKSKALKAEFDRVKQKYDIDMTTEDEVLKLQSEYETNNYLIEELKYQQDEILQNLSLLSNTQVLSLDSSSLPNVLNLKYQPSENIKSLQMQVKALEENTNVISSINKPQVKIEDKYNVYGYDDYNEKILSDLPEQQNQLMLNINFRFFDTSTKHKVESSKLSSLALKQKLNYAKNQEKMRFDLAIKKLNTQKLKIESLKSAVEMGNSVYEIIKEKYQNGIVDNIAYLDALSKKTYNTALYKQALNNYEIAKANYYFTSGISYKELLDKF